MIVSPHFRHFLRTFFFDDGINDTVEDEAAKKSCPDPPVKEHLQTDPPVEEHPQALNPQNPQQPNMASPPFVAYPPTLPASVPTDAAREFQFHKRAELLQPIENKKQAAKFTANLLEEIENDAEARNRPIYVPYFQLKPNPPSPTTRQIIDNAAAAAALMSEDVSEGHLVLDWLYVQERIQQVVPYDTPQQIVT
jgi:hypothetical protein